MEIGCVAAPPPAPLASSSSSEKIELPSSSSLAFWNHDAVSDSSDYEDDDEDYMESEGLFFGQRGNPWDDLQDVPSFTTDNSLVEDLNLYCRKAIAQFNSDNCEDYVFNKVEKMHTVLISGFLYYINFSAFKKADDSTNAHGDDEESKLPSLRTFEAVVYQPHSDPELKKFEVDSCRFKRN